MQQETMKAGLLSIGGIVLTLGVLFSGLMAAPTTADAFWWPWWKEVHAEENATSTHVITIQKYIDGSHATAGNANNASFPMNASWNDGGAESGSFALNAGNSYAATTTPLTEGASYSTSENLEGDTVSASCDTEGDDAPFALVGYTSGTSLAAAQAATLTTTPPSFTNLSHDMHVIVWNKTCDDDPSAGGLTGEVTGGSTGGGEGELAVTSIDAEKTTAIANGTFGDGWRYVFNITVPTDETDLAMKFENWLHSNASSTIPVANNMRISSEQTGTSTSPVLLTAANTYSSPPLTMVEDLDSGTPGLQVQVLVEVSVPAGTLNGTYSTNYGVRSE